MTSRQYSNLGSDKLSLKSAFSMFDKEKKGFITPQKIIDFIESTKHISENLKSQLTE